MIKISDVNSSGKGVGRQNGMVVFVPETISGETVEAEIISNQKNYKNARLVNILEKSPHRRSPFCPHFGTCGGCTLMHMDYSEQLRTKENIVKNAISRIGKIDCKINPIIASENETGYRNKASFPVKNGKIGYYEQGSHNIVEIKRCPLVKEEINKVLLGIKPFIKQYSSDICHLVVRSAGSHTMATIVTDKKKFDHKDALIEILSPLKINSININFNNSPKRILGDKTINIYGSPTIPYSILGNIFNVSPTAFLQVNDTQTEKLYSTALSLVNLNNKSVTDAYCGIGTISLALSKKAKEVIGIELNPAAIDNAKSAALLNKTRNVQFLCGKCETLIPQILRNKSKDTVLFADPPRAGMENSFIEAVALSKIEKMVYISCDPASLARDMRRLSNHGFIPLSITPVDMFPNTSHVETVVMMEK